MKRAAPQIVRVSAERVREELEKTMAARTPSLAFFKMEAAGLMDRILPELSACRGVPQGDFHSYDVLDHSLYACDGAPAGEIEIRFAALLHDIGKASTYEAESGSGRPTFYGHEEESERMALDICRRLKFSRASEQKILRLIRHHMFHYTPDWSDAAVRRFIARVGDDLLEDLFTLRRADTYGMVHRYRRDRGLEELYARIQRVLRERQALSVRDLAVDGHILESEAGIPKGPDMGTVIDHLMEAVLDDPSMNTKEKLLELARSFYATYLRDEDSGS
jgi:poly(A) polymerase/tRNA nucleotidyltransferase (CCA-adding enzyme)